MKTSYERTLIDALTKRVDAIESQLKKELQPKIEVGSWWYYPVLDVKVEVSKVENDKVFYTHEGVHDSYVCADFFIEHYTPCDPPKEEIWYLCTEDLFDGAFTRGKEYKATCIHDNSIEFIDNIEREHILSEKYLQYFTSPIER